MKNRRLYALFACLCLLTACSGPAEPSFSTPTGTPWWISPTPDPNAPQSDDDSIAFYVGDEPVYFSEFGFHFTTAVNNYYGGGADAGSGFDPSLPLSEQNYPGTDMSWEEMFTYSVKDDLHRAIAMYSESKAEGYVMGQWERENIDSFFAALDEYLLEQGITMDMLFLQQYGMAMSRERVREIQTRYFTAIGFETQKREGMTFTDAELEAFYEERKEEAADMPDCTAVTLRYINIRNKQTALDVLEKFEAGDRTEESFDELAELYTEDEQFSEFGSLSSDVMPQTSEDNYSDVEIWLFDSVRQPGDYTHLEIEGGHILIYFVSKGDPLWKLWSRSGKLEGYTMSILEKYPLVYEE